MKASEEAVSFALKILGKDAARRIMEPRNAVNFKGKDAFRRYILIKAPRGKRNEYVHYMDQFHKKLLSANSAVNVTIDVNPYSII